MYDAVDYLRMPELPEVEMARRFFEERLKGRRVASLEVKDGKMLTGGSERSMKEAFVGNSVDNAYRHGKNLLVRIGDEHLYIHLGMSGSLHLVNDDEHTSHERLRLGLDEGALVLDDPRRFGRFGLYHRIEDLLIEKDLGPDALTVANKVFTSRLEGRRGSIKPLLLDQSIIAGVGNLYADEALFQELLHPATRVDTVTRTELIGLGKCIRKVLETSISVRTDFSQFPEGFLLRDRRDGAPCPRCSTNLMATRIGGRTTVLCPECQSRRTER
jgi:formamidopyrimidine-DNA glycosylase